MMVTLFRWIITIMREKQFICPTFKKNLLNLKLLNNNKKLATLQDLNVHLEQQLKLSKQLEVWFFFKKLDDAQSK